MKKISFLLFCLLISFSLRASHIVGGDISYTHLTGMSYKVTLKLYRDCGGAALATIANVEAGSASLALNMSMNLNLVSSGVLNSYCNGLATTCTSTSSTLPGFEYYTYEGNITLPATASDWIFEYGMCCRSSGVVNLQNASSQSIYLYTLLDNSAGSGGFNNSVRFMVDNPVVFNTGQTYTINQCGIDSDGDSLHFSLVHALNTSATVPCTYNTGYSASAPFGSAGSMLLNPANGDITFSNSMMGSYVTAIRADEYRNGVLIATSWKELEFLFMNGAPNNLPSLSGVNGGSSYVTSLNVCPSATLSFTIVGSDIDVSDSVHVNVLATDITGYSVNTSSTLQETLTFNWTPTIADIRPQPYLLVVQAADNHCARINRGYFIYINQCNQDSVWAGDANADYVVNNYDVLNIGIGNGVSGIVRPGASTNWVAEYCPDWSGSFLSGVNHKHADCNGDGTIDAADLAAVTSNYGQFHLKAGHPGTYKTLGLPDLSFDLTAVNAHPGATLNVPVMLGSATVPLNSLYGIAGHIVVSNVLSGPVAMNANSSWLGNAANSIVFTKSINANELAFTLVRKDQNNTNGFGQIGAISVPLSAGANPNSVIHFQFTDVKMILNDGTELTDYNVINDSLPVTYPAGVNDVAAQSGISVFPNPCVDFLTIQGSSFLSGETRVSVTDLSGRKIVSEKGKAGERCLKLNTASWPRGHYMLTVHDGESNVNRLVTK